MLPTNYQCEGQMTIFDFLPPPQFGKMSQELSVQESQKEEISDVSLKNWQESKTLKYQYLCLMEGNGCPPGALKGTDGVWHGEPMMPNFGESRSVEKGFASSHDLTTPMQMKSSFNCSEKPTIERPSKLSQILEHNPDPKYNLSQKACLGILRRAEGKGKKLPDLLERTLKAQSGLPVDDITYQDDDVKAVSIEGNGSRPSHHGSGFSEGAMYTLNAVEHHSVCIGNGQVNDAICPSDELCKTLNCLDDPMKVIVEPMCVGNGQVAQSRLQDKVGTLNCMHDQQAVIVPENVPAIAIDRAAYNQGKNAQYKFSVEEELAQTLVAKGPGGVMQTQ